MPTLLRKNGFRFFFYSNEGHELPHVHVVGRGGELKIWLDPIMISKAYNMSPKDQREALRITRENANLFLEKWIEWRGKKI